MKNKKLISLVCALSMVISMFAGLTIVSAAGEGLTLTKTAQADKTHATIVIGYNGFDDGLSGATVALKLPAGAKVQTTMADGFDAKPVINPQNGTIGDEGTYRLVYSDSVNGKNDKKELATLTIELASELSDDYEVALQDGTKLDTITDNDTGATASYKLGDAEKPLTTSSATIAVDPSATPKPTAEPALDKPAKDDNAQKVDVPEAPASVTVTKGLDLEATKVDANNYTLKINYKDFADGLSGATVALKLPAGAKVQTTMADGFDAKPVINPQNGTIDDEGTYKLVYSDSVNGKNDNGLLATLAIEIPEGKELTQNLYVQLLEGTKIDTITDNDTGATVSYKLGDETRPLLAAWTTLEAATDFVPDTKLADLVDDDNAKLSEEEKAAGTTVYVAVEAKKANGEDAEYGADKDYVAYYDGVELTQGQLNNYLNGEFGDVADAISHITFKYNDGVTVKAQIVKQAADGTKTVVDSGTSAPPAAPTATPQAGASNVKLATLKKSINTSSGKQSNTATVTLGTDTDGSALAFGDLTINVTTASFDVVSGTGIAIEYTPVATTAQAAATTNTTTKYISMAQAGTNEPIPQSADNKYTISFTPIAKGTVTYTVIYTDPKGKKTEQTAVYTVSAAANNNGGGSGSGSSNTSSGGGAIANGNLNSGTAGTYPGTFTDLGDASWATEAITALAAKGIVSGLGDGTFDPNGALTRAAYAQMLVNAIGKQGEAADVSFDDVPTDAWFYHNVAVAAKYGIVSGYGDGNFGPYDLITREQMALMTLKAAQVMSVNLTGAEVPAFSDDAAIADWSRDAVYTLANVGIINGMGDGTFAPKANATRAQAATIIYNTFVK